MDAPKRLDPRRQRACYRLFIVCRIILMDSETSFELDFVGVKIQKTYATKARKIIVVSKNIFPERCGDSVSGHFPRAICFFFFVMNKVATHILI